MKKNLLEILVDLKIEIFKQPNNQAMTDLIKKALDEWRTLS